MNPAVCAEQSRHRGVIALMLCALLVLQLLSLSLPMSSHERMPGNAMPMLELSLHPAQHGAHSLQCAPEPSQGCLDLAQASMDTSCCVDDTSVDCSVDHCMQLNAFSPRELVGAAKLVDAADPVRVLGSPRAPTYSLYQPPISRFAA